MHISRISHTRNVCAKQAAEGVPLDDHEKWMSGGWVSEERWDGREKQLQIIVGWGRKGEGRTLAAWIMKAGQCSRGCSLVGVSCTRVLKTIRGMGLDKLCFSFPAC